MAKIAEINQSGFNEWLQGRPNCIIDMVKRYPPDVLYRMKSTGQRVTIIAYAEDGTVRVLVSGDYNAVIFDREVFGVNIEPALGLLYMRVFISKPPSLICQRQLCTAS